MRMRWVWCHVSKNLVSALNWFELDDQEHWLEESEKAKIHLESIVELNPLPAPWYWADLAICYALEDNRALMEQAIVKTREVSHTTFWRYGQEAGCEMLIAVAYLVLGENDEAIDTLEKACNMDSQFILNRRIDLLFIFDRLRGNPRFDALLED